MTLMHFFKLAIGVISMAALVDPIHVLAQEAPAILATYAFQTDGKEAISSHIDKAVSALEADFPDSAFYYVEKAGEIAQRLKLPIHIAEVHYAKGYLHDATGDLARSIDHYEKSRVIYERLGRKGEVIKCMNAKATAAYFQGDYEMALSLYLPTLEYIDNSGGDPQLSDVLNNIGVIYRLTDKPEEALQIYLRSLSLNIDQGDSILIATSYQNIGVVYSHENQLDSALANFDRAHAILSVSDASTHVPSLLNAYAEAFLNAGIPDKARVYAKKAADYLGEYEEQETTLKMYLLQGKIEMQAMDYVASIEALEEGLQIALGTERKNVIRDFYKSIYETYVAAAMPLKAIESMEKYMALHEEIQDIEKIKNIEELQTRYETAEKEKEIEQLKLLEEINILKMSRQRNAIFAGIIFLIFMGILLFNIFYQKRQIQSQNLIISQSLLEKETLLREIHHRVKNNLQFISSLLRLQSKHITDSGARGALKEGQDRVKSMALIHQNLYQDRNLAGVDIGVYFEQLIGNLFDSYNIRPSQVSLHLDIEKISLDVDTVIPIGLIVNELVSNALKYAFPNDRVGQIQVTIKEVSDHLMVTVSDNGIGISTNIKKKLGTSFGYRLINVLKTQLKADLDIKNDPGSTITLTVRKFSKTETDIPM